MWRSGPIGWRALGVSFGASIRVRSPIGPASIARSGGAPGPITLPDLGRFRWVGESGMVYARRSACTKSTDRPCLACRLLTVRKKDFVVWHE